jgi:hypothetical protein
MELAAEDLASIVDELLGAEYGAPSTLELTDGRSLALLVELDYDTSIRDTEGFGTFSEYSYDYGDRGSERPDGMNGNAEKLPVDRGSFVWWMPPTDGPKRGTPEFATFRALVRDICESGYCGLVVELREGTDAYGAPIPIRVASLFGIEHIYETFHGENAYARDVVAELVAEVLSDDA